jgi:hypothetical protein
MIKLIPSPHDEYDYPYCVNPPVKDSRNFLLFLLDFMHDSQWIIVCSNYYFKQEIDAIVADVHAREWEQR